MFPIDWGSLLTKMTGKNNKFEVQNHEVFMQTGSIVTRIPHASDYEDGSYSASSQSPLNGQYSIPVNFVSKSECTNAFALPIKFVKSLAMVLQSWKSASGSNVESVIFKLSTEGEKSEDVRIQIFGEGVPRSTHSLSLTFFTEKRGLEVDVDFKFSVNELLTFLYPIRKLGKSGEHVVIHYKPDENRLINGLPVYAEFVSAERNVVVGIQVCSVGADGEELTDDPNSFITPDGEVKDEFGLKEVANDDVKKKGRKTKPPVRQDFKM